MITREQCRAARALIDMSREQLAGHAKVAMRTIADFEVGHRQPIPATLAAIQSALELHGVQFTSNTHSDGVELPRKYRREDGRLEIAIRIAESAAPSCGEIMSLILPFKALAKTEGEVRWADHAIAIARSASSPTAFAYLVEHLRQSPFYRRLATGGSDGGDVER